MLCRKKSIPVHSFQGKFDLADIKIKIIPAQETLNCPKDVQIDKTVVNHKDILGFGCLSLVICHMQPSHVFSTFLTMV